MNTRNEIEASRELARVSILAKPPHKPSLLLVEDDSDDIDLFRSSLSGIDCNLVVTNSAISASEILQSVAFDLIFLDLLLSGGSTGLEVLSQMEKTENHTSVVIVTGAMSDLIKPELNKFKVITTLLKPVDNSAIVKVLKQLNLWDPLCHSTQSKNL